MKSTPTTVEYILVPLATENETNIHQIDKKQPNKAFDKIIDILGKIDTFETAIMNKIAPKMRIELLLF